jgi:Arc/MetJ-type ribon-helix-helix transcriptional regulator
VLREQNSDVIFARVDRELKDFVRQSAQQQYVSESHIVRKAVRALQREQAQGGS